MHIIKNIKNIIKSKPTLFATPGHMQGYHTMRGFGELFGKDIFKGDFAEIRSMDNLQNPSGPILKSMQRAAEIYGTKATFFLVNGTSSGIIALMLATAGKGDKVLIARNAHKSVINALILNGAEPVWVETYWDEYWNIPTSVTPATIAKKLEQTPDIKALCLTSPTYQGIATDIKAIAEICRQKNVMLIIDEAHGTLWPFSEQLPDSSIHLGADACVQSLHKTGSCLNQGAVLHLSQNSKISPERVQQALNVINTTSPSYILLSSIEASIEYLNSQKGRQKLDQLINNIIIAKNGMNEAVFLKNSDPTKIFFGIDGVSGDDLSDYLEEKFNIEVELNNELGLLALTGIGTSKQTLEKLEKAVKITAKNLQKTYKKPAILPYISPQISMTPSQAFFSKSERIKPEDAVGCICREIIVKYPPGIPLINPGEVIQEEHLEFLRQRKQIEVIVS